MVSPNADRDVTPVHAIVMHHGLWGHPLHLDYIASQLKARFADEGDAATATAVRIVNISCNEKLLTYDGIEVCGERAVRFLESRFLGPAIRGSSLAVPSQGGIGVHQPSTPSNASSERGCSGSGSEPLSFSSAGGAAAQGRRGGDRWYSVSGSGTGSGTDDGSDGRGTGDGSDGRGTGDGSGSSSCYGGSQDSLEGAAAAASLSAALVAAGRGGRRCEGEVQPRRPLERVAKISFVGYSMGGLILRYVVGRLWSKGVFNQVEPCNFITFATPHLGAAKPATSLFNRTFNGVASFYTQRSGRQMFLDDSFHGGRPLLEVMCDEAGPFVSGLAAFKQRCLYANVYYDRTVPYKTAAIRVDSPYDGSSGMVPMPIDDRYRCIVHPVPRDSLKDDGPRPKEARINHGMLAAMAAMAPLWLTYMLGFGIYGWAHVTWRQPERLAVLDWLELHGYVLTDERERPSAADRRAAERIADELDSSVLAEELAHEARVAVNAAKATAATAAKTAAAATTAETGAAQADDVKSGAAMSIPALQKLPPSSKRVRRGGGLRDGMDGEEGWQQEEEEEQGQGVKAHRVETEEEEEGRAGSSSSGVSSDAGTGSRTLSEAWGPAAAQAAARRGPAPWWLPRLPPWAACSGPPGITPADDPDISASPSSDISAAGSLDSEQTTEQTTAAAAAAGGTAVATAAAADGDDAVGGWGTGSKARLVRRMAASLNTLEWEKHDVDTGHVHSHGAIVVRNPQYHTGCEDVVHHFVDHLLV